MSIDNNVEVSLQSRLVLQDILYQRPRLLISYPRNFVSNCLSPEADNFVRATLIAFLVVVLATASATSGPFEDADAAYGTSDYWVRIQRLFPNGVPDAQRRFITEAQYRLGMHYYFGKGVPQNYEEATKWFRLAADQGLDRAQFELGKAYEDGRGVPQSYVDAEKWFRLAAEQGLDVAQLALGLIYSSGRGVPQNYDEAAKWYRRAADQGLARAEFALGSVYQFGHGVPQDYLEATKWYRRAADQGFASAQYNLGSMYYLGLGVPKDLVSAKIYYNLAGSQGHEGAIRSRDELEKQMTPDQIREARKLADEWKEKSSTHGQGAQ
jgi:TPR repeat protein